MRRAALVTLVLGLAAVGPGARAQDAPSGVARARLERLVSVGRLWATVKYFHPFLASRPIDWDSALVAALPQVGAAATPAAFAEAVQSMLASLDDPVTRVVSGEPAVAHPEDPDPHVRSLPGGVRLISLTHYGDLADFSIVGRLRALGDSLRSAHGVVIDLRTEQTGDDFTAISMLTLAGLDRALVPRTVRAPGQRGRYHSGLVSGTAASSGGYFAGTYTMTGDLIEPADTGSAATPVVFVINERSLLPPVALALQDAGLGRIVCEGPASDGPAVTPMILTLADSVRVAVRMTELVHADGRTGLVADTVVSAMSAGGPDLALAVAQRWAQALPPRAAGPPVAVASEPLPERAYGTPLYPSEPFRELAAFKMWAMMEFLFPYRDLMDEPPITVLRTFLPRFEAARDSLEYALTVARMWAHLRDNHGFVDGPVTDEVIGVARPPVRLRWIEGRPVVVQLSPETAARAAGVRIGDVIVAVDGEPVERREAWLRPLVGAATPQASDYYVASRLLLGPDSSTVKVTLKGADGRLRVVTLPRARRFQGSSFGGRDGPIIRRLSPHIGYVDLDRLTNDMVDSMFIMLADTRGIIFDMRGYPHGTAWTIAPRLTDRDHVPVAAFYRMQPMPRDTADRTVYSFVQTIPSAPPGPRYHGRTVMLIDERTQSQAEHTGLFLRGANGTTFIGSPTAGANGDVVAFPVPGGITLSFSGQGVTWPDGTRLQRRGLMPDVPVRPTIAGIRAGRDEVLASAIRWLESHAPRRSAAPH